MTLARLLHFSFSHSATSTTMMQRRQSSYSRRRSTVPKKQPGRGKSERKGLGFRAHVTLIHQQALAAAKSLPTTVHLCQFECLCCWCSAASALPSSGANSAQLVGVAGYGSPWMVPVVQSIGMVPSVHSPEVTPIVLSVAVVTSFDTSGSSVPHFQWTFFSCQKQCHCFSQCCCTEHCVVTPRCQLAVQNVQQGYSCTVTIQRLSAFLQLLDLPTRPNQRPFESLVIPSRQAVLFRSHPIAQSHSARCMPNAALTDHHPSHVRFPSTTHLQHPKYDDDSLQGVGCQLEDLKLPAQIWPRHGKVEQHDALCRTRRGALEEAGGPISCQ